MARGYGQGYELGPGKVGMIKQFSAFTVCIVFTIGAFWHDGGGGHRTA